MPTSSHTGSRPTVDALPLPHQLFLLSLQSEKGRLDEDSEPVRGSLLAAAAIAELRIAELLHDRDGKAARTNATTPATLDPFLAEVLSDVPPGRPRSWFEVLESRWGKAEGVRAIRALADRIDQELPGLRKALSYAIAVRRGA